MKAWLLLALLSLPLPALACKPAPVANCEDKELIPLHVPSFENLAGKTAAFQKELTGFLLKTPPKGHSSCFNSNFAVFYIGQARESAPKRGGKICSGFIQRIKKEAEGLVSADSPEWKAVKEENAQARLSILAKEVRAALEEFLHRH